MPEGAKENRGPKEAYPDTVGQRRSASLFQPAWNFDIKIPLVRGVPLKPRAVRRNASQIETHFVKSNLVIGCNFFPVVRKAHKGKQFRFTDLMVFCYCFVN